MRRIMLIWSADCTLLISRALRTTFMICRTLRGKPYNPPSWMVLILTKTRTPSPLWMNCRFIIQHFDGAAEACDKGEEDPSVRAAKEERIYVMQNDGSGNAVHVWVSSRREMLWTSPSWREQRMAGFRAGSDMILKNEERLPKEVRAPTAESGAISHRASSISFSSGASSSSATSRKGSSRPRLSFKLTMKR